MLITPENAIQIVLTRKTKDAKFRPYETKLEKCLFFIAAGLLGAGAVTALLAYFWKNPYVVLGALLALLVSTVVIIIYQIVSALPELIKLQNIEREISNPLLVEFNNDMDLINELAQTCESHHLSYARENYQLMAKQLRERISLLVGAIDKVGVIPLAITGYLSYVKAQKEGLVAFGGIEWILVAFITLYLFALRMTSTAQWMESISGIYEHAIAMKSKRES